MKRRQAQSPKQGKPPDDKTMLTIKIENFGPISEGKINLKPLTVLVGPNGCGKSHAATLFYTMAQIEQAYYINYQHFKSMLPSGDKRNVILKEYDKIHKQRRNGASMVKTNILRNVIDPNTELKRIMTENWSEPKTLIQWGKASATLRISYPTHGNAQIKLDPNNFRVSGPTIPNVRINFTDASDTITLPYRSTTKQETWNIDVPSDCRGIDIYNALWQAVLELPRRYKGNVYYFPAERAGLTIANKAMTTNYLYGRDPKMPRIVIDYLTFLIHLSTEESDFADMTREAEEKIIRGEIIATDAPESDRSPDIYYKSDGHKLPLRLTASSIKDLASFFLYLKHSAKVGDLVILEEPEINLHPTAQIHLARFIVRLINAGLYVVVTTHGPYFLEQMSHCVKAGHIDNDGVSDILPKEERIPPDDVAPYKFVRHKSGYKIVDMPVSTEGIPQEEFLNVDEALYDELLKLRRLEHE